MTTEEAGTVPASAPIAAGAAEKLAAAEAQGSPQVQPEATQPQSFHVFVNTPHQSVIRLEQVNTGDTVASIRQLLLEIPETCFYTSYTLHLLPPAGSAAAKGAVSVELNDFAEIASLEAMVPGARIAMALAPYTVREARRHVRRLREVLSAPPVAPPKSAAVLAAEEAEKAPAGAGLASDGAPAAQESSQPPAAPASEAEECGGGFVEVEAEEEEETEAASKQEGDSAAAAAATTTAVVAAEQGGGEDPGKLRDDAIDAAMLAAVEQALAPCAQPTQLPAPTIPAPSGLAAFYPLPSFLPAAAEPPAEAAAAALPACVGSVTFSGFNPPPARCRLRGELLYLEVRTLEQATYHITATANGFFANSSKGESFDPQSLLASDGGRFEAHSLLHLLQMLSPLFAVRWPQLLQAACDRAAASPALVDPFSPSGSLPSADSPASRQWNAPPAAARHALDMNRAELDLLDTFGQEEHGLPRDWNEEFQSCKELPRDSVSDKVMRARMINKVTNDFSDAATQGARAIVDGHIPSINPMDEAPQRVYVHNQIFFSSATDNRGTYTDIGGNEAARAAANHDLQGVQQFEQADVPGLSSLLTAVVDYKGRRLVAQSIIPGILQGESASTLVYGSVDNGHSVASDEAFLALMQGAGAKLHLAERTIAPLGLTPAEEEERALAEARDGKPSRMSATEAQTLCGPVECKGIEGSDRRKYVLDLVRLGPRDAYYVSERGEAARAKAAEAAEAMKQRTDEAQVALKAIQDAGGAEKASEEDKLAAEKLRKAATDAMRAAHVARAEAADYAVEGEAPKGHSTVLRAELTAMFCKQSVAKRKQASALEREVEEKADAAAKARASAGAGAEGDAAKPPPPLTEEEKAAKAAKAAAHEEKASAGDGELIVLNPNVFMAYAASVDPAQAEGDTARAVAAAAYLRGTICPAYVRNAVRGSITATDGASLTSTMHHNGINMRYLGRLFEETMKYEPRLAVVRQLRVLLEVEMLARAAKHLLTTAMLDADPAVLLEVVSHFFNCLFLSGGKAAGAGNGKAGTGVKGAAGAAGNGNPQAAAAAVSKKAAKKARKKGGDAALISAAAAAGLAPPSLPAAVPLTMTAASLWEQIAKEVKSRFRHTLRPCWGPAATAKGAEMKAQGAAVGLVWAALSEDCSRAKLHLLRRISTCCGVRIASRDYQLDGTSSSSSSSGDGDPNSTVVFSPDDIVDLVPVTKFSKPAVPFERAQTLLDHGRFRLASGQVQMAYELVQESAMLLFQVCCAPHLSLISTCSTLAMVMYHAGDVQAAVQQQQTVLSLAMQLCGLDSADVANSHGNLALFLHAAGQTELALQHVQRCIYLTSLQTGGTAGNAEIMHMYQRMASFYQDRGNYEHAVRCCDEAVKHCDLALMAPQVMQLFHAKAIACSLAGKYTDAVAAETRCYQYYKQKGDVGDKAAQQSKHFLRAFMAGDIAKKQAIMADLEAEREEAKQSKKAKRKKRNKKR